MGTVRMAAEKMGVTAAELEATLEQYNEAGSLTGAAECGLGLFCPSTGIMSLTVSRGDQNQHRGRCCKGQFLFSSGVVALRF